MKMRELSSAHLGDLAPEYVNKLYKVYNEPGYRDWETDRKSTRLNSSHITRSRMPSSA